MTTPNVTLARLNERIKKEEEELAALMAKETGPNEESEPNEDEGTEDSLVKTEVVEEPEEGDDDSDELVKEDKREATVDWEKRFKDAQRYITKLTEDIKALKEAGTSSKLPTDPEKIKAWMNHNPIAVDIIKSIVSEEMKETKEVVRNISNTLTKRDAEKMLRERHPDFDDFKKDKHFKAWVAESPEEVKELLYSSKGLTKEGVQKISWLLDTYRKTATAGKTDTNRDVARTPVKSTKTKMTDKKEGGYRYKESQIAGMSDREFERIYEDFEKARIEGKVLYDL